MPIRVVELFAGVGGFRIGLEGRPGSTRPDYEVVWSNQWEPSTMRQHASKVYESHWPNANHSNEDISTVPTSTIPDHDMLVGGFPCQDYSVASALKNAGGLIGKKGVLWWQIHRILHEKGRKSPKYLFLENVDRLLKSPVDQRGRDFAVMLSSLDKLGYAVEWRVINAAEYGMPQRRRRIFILGYKKGSAGYERLKIAKNTTDPILKSGVFAEAFPVKADGTLRSENLSEDLVKLSEGFNKKGSKSPFHNTGFMVNGRYHTMPTVAEFDGPFSVLGDVLVPLKEVPQVFFVCNEDMEKWKYLKGAKKQVKYSKAGGYHYNYSEGGMVFPDSLDRPSRTIITAEGGTSPSRFKHVVLQNGKLRRLVPKELERLNMFPDDHTLLKGVTDAKRAFFMGNALVVGIVEKIANRLVLLG